MEGGGLMLVREELELREARELSEYAMLSAKTRGRDRPEPECDVRTAFMRDRDRIVHCKAFRRLKDKTQVFLAPQGDHYRTRLMHTLEVSQIARTLARCLSLNEDLVEAIALGHDLGHTPFGHAGERALNEVSPLGFSHSEQSVRIAEVLEKEGHGLNLTWEVRDGMRNHGTANHPATLEGQAVRLADKMAYIHHDMDDGERAGFLKVTTSSKLPKNSHLSECRRKSGRPCWSFGVSCSTTFTPTRLRSSKNPGPARCCRNSTYIMSITRKNYRESSGGGWNRESLQTAAPSTTYPG